MSRRRAVQEARRHQQVVNAAFRESSDGEEPTPHMRHPQGHHRFYETLGYARTGWSVQPDQPFDDVPFEVQDLAEDLATRPGIERFRIPFRLRRLK